MPPDTVYIVTSAKTGVPLSVLTTREAAEPRRNVFNNEVAAACDAAEARVESLEAALLGAENDWCFLFNLADSLELPADVRRALAENNLRVIRAALAVSGNQP